MKVFRNRAICWIRILIESYHSFASKLRKIRRYLEAGGGYVFNIDRALPGPQCLFAERGEGWDGDLFPTGAQDTLLVIGLYNPSTCDLLYTATIQPLHRYRHLSASLNILSTAAHVLIEPESQFMTKLFIYL